jgi:iron(III) transport system permease protein
VTRLQNSTWRSSPGRTICLGIAAVIFVVCCVMPVGYLLWTAGRDSVVHAAALDARQRGLLYNTAALGAGTALLSSCIGVPLGLALARAPLQPRVLLRAVLAAPLLIPPHVAGLCWIYIGNPRGVVAELLGSDLVPDWTYSLAGATVALSLVFYPLPMLATEVAMRRIEGRLEEAAVLVATPLRVLARISLPLAAPMVLAASLVTFVLAVSEFGVPGLLRVRVYATEVFTAFAALYDFGSAMALAVPLLVLCVAVAGVAAALVGDRLLVTRRGTVSRPLALESWRWPAMAGFVLVLLVALVLPLAVLVREASGADAPGSVVGAAGEAIRNSLVSAAVAATTMTSIAIGLGYARARSKRRAGLLMDVLYIAMFSVPSTIVGVGLIGVWNRPGPLGAAYGTDFMLVLAYVARFLPVAALMVAAGIRYVPISHEESAALAGAGWLTTQRRVVLPQIRLALLACWVVTFILAFGDLGASVLVAPPGEATLPIRVYTLIANAPPSQVAVLALLQIVVAVVPLAVLAMTLPLRGSQ